jgi:outer membrane protein assembly factor BamB
MLRKAQSFSRLFWLAPLCVSWSLFPIPSNADVGTQKWTVVTGGYVYSSPVIGADGTIYVGSDDNKLYAINPNALVNPNGTITPKWTFQTGNRVYSSPAVGDDGTVYVGSVDGNLYAITPNGTQKWAFPTENWVESSPAMGADGTVYVGSWDRKVYAVNPDDGTEKWAFETGAYVKSSPTVGADGTIFVGSDDHNLYAINPDGSRKWAFTTGDRVRSTAAVASDGTVYVGADDNKLYAIDPNGTLRWTFTTGGFVFSSPVVGSDGTIYVGSDDKKVYAIHSDGTKKWEIVTGSFVYSSPAIGPDGTIYVGSHDFRLYAIDPGGAIKGTFQTGGYVWSSPAVGDDGTVYVGSGDQKFYAVIWTADTTAPVITSTSPVDNASGVGIHTVVTATFSEVMDSSTITASTFLVADDAQNISGTVTYGGVTATFTPTAPLAYETAYTATMTAAAEDVAGNTLTESRSWSFTTGPYTGPSISCNPAFLSNACEGGQNAPSQSLSIWNSGGGNLSYSVTTGATWLSCTPVAGTSTGESDSISVQYATASLASGTYNTAITITDANAINSPVTIPVTVTVGRFPPIAQAGPDQTVGEGADVLLNGANSTDPDDGIASYHWEQVGGSPTVTLTDADTAEAGFTAPDVGLGGVSLQFELTVTDNGGLQDTDTCIVNITGDNDPPEAQAGPDQTVGEGADVLLNGANSTDPDDGIASYHWEQVGGSPTVTLTDADTAEAGFTAPDVGLGGVSLQFELTVTDNGGLQDTDTCIVNITGDNDPPESQTEPNDTDRNDGGGGGGGCFVSSLW